MITSVLSNSSGDASMSSLPAFDFTSPARRFVLSTLGALALAAGLGAPAQAGVAMPALAAAPAPAAAAVEAEPVRWVCGPWRCVWRPNYPAYWYVPPYARGWGPPVRPNCYWRRNWGAWVHVCP